MGTSPSNIDYDYVVDVVGFLAGLFVSVALLPQIRRAHQRKSAKDLSIFWQGTVVVGLSMQLVFLRYNGLWSVFIPVLVELVLIVYLTGLKLHFDGIVDGSQEAPVAEDEGALRNPNGGGNGDEVCVKYKDELEEEESGERGLFIRDFRALRNQNGDGDGDLGVKEEDGLEEEDGEKGILVPDSSARAFESLSRNPNDGGDGDLRVKYEDGLEKDSGERSFVVSDFSAQALEPLLGEEGQEGRPNEVTIPACEAPSAGVTPHWRETPQNGAFFGDRRMGRVLTMCGDREWLGRF